VEAPIPVNISNYAYFEAESTQEILTIVRGDTTILSGVCTSVKIHTDSLTPGDP